MIRLGTALALVALLSVPAIANGKRFKTMEAYYAYRNSHLRTMHSNRHSIQHTREVNGLQHRSYPELLSNHRDTRSSFDNSKLLPIDYPDATGTMVVDVISQYSTYDRSCSIQVLLPTGGIPTPYEVR